jgi:tetratricopeptide (TPR) repeat protein
MDGKRLRKWCLSGCLAVGALGCNRNAVHTPMDGMPGTQPVSGVPMTSAKKPFWKSTPSVAADVLPAEPEKKGPAGPEWFVACADVQLESAFDEKTNPAFRQDLLDKARQGYQKALQLDPNHRGGTLGMARYYSRLGDRERAVEVYKKYLTANPTDKDVAHEVALAHARWRDWAGAVAWCEFALRLDPENLSTRKTMAFCLARGGRWEDGFAAMCQVMPEAQARYLMARVLEHQNQPAACRQQLQLAIQADPNFADARDFLAELDSATAPGAVPNPNGLQQAGFNQPR